MLEEDRVRTASYLAQVRRPSSQSEWRTAANLTREKDEAEKAAAEAEELAQLRAAAGKAN